MSVKASEGPNRPARTCLQSNYPGGHSSSLPGSMDVLDNYRMPCVVNWFASHLHIVGRIRRAQKPANQG